MPLVDGGKRYLLTHGHIYNKENMPKGPYDAIIYGHSHLWELSRNAEGKAICNTGSITFPKGGNPLHLHSRGWQVYYVQSRYP